MVFTCRQCGACCMYMGDFIVIEKQLGSFTFGAESVSTGTPFTAEIDVDKRHLFLDHTFTDQHPTACRFLRPDGALCRCTIHRDSPTQCKFYRCVVMRILDPQEVLLGTVRGTLSLHTEDPSLRAVWEEIERKRPKTDADAESWIANFLIERGYRVE
ncbi:MAG: YkgJ family cysteine cluster protein [Methanoregula sp.]|nr:YkgJ family cysteine cluster protein [Methanoregula sp.]